MNRAVFKVGAGSLWRRRLSRLWKSAVDWVSVCVRSASHPRVPDYISQGWTSARAPLFKKLQRRPDQSHGSCAHLSPHNMPSRSARCGRKLATAASTKNQEIIHSAKCWKMNSWRPFAGSAVYTPCPVINPSAAILDRLEDWSVL